MKWFVRLPLLVRIPLLAAVMLFAIAMLVTQIAVFSLSRQYEQLTERVGQVYLDGLSASVLPHYQGNDPEGVLRAMRQSLDVYLGIVDRQLALIDRNRGVVAHVAGPNLETTTAPPEEALENPKGSFYESESKSVWVWRELGESGIIAANLDISAFARERASLHLRLILIGAALSTIAALGGYLAIRRIQRPLRTLSEHLAHAFAFGPEAIEAAHIPKGDEDTAVLMQAYNRMAVAVQERQRLSDELAKQDQQAMLGRIAATLAHEIRNPLNGMMAALQTVRMYGHDTRSRDEALAFIDRGIQSLQGVAEATLNAYRATAPGPDLTQRDLEDVLRLVTPHAARKEVQMNHEVSLAVSIGLDAFKIRQIALNLLLNAIETSPKRGSVTLHASCKNSIFTLTVSDQGAGLPQEARNFLLSEGSIHSDRSLGLEIVRRLTHELGGEIAIKGQPGPGSSIELTFPLAREDAH